MTLHPFERIFAPRSIAVFGAEGDDVARAIGPRVLRNLRAAGFRGAVHAIGPHAGGAEGVPAVRSLADVDGRVDLAILATHASEMLGAVRACGERGVAGAIISADLARLEGGGPDLSRDLRAEAARHGLRLIGPHSFGVIRPAVRLNATFGNGSAAPGTLGLISQSGAMCATVLDWAAAHRIGFSIVASIGQAVDVDLGDLLEYLALDPETRSVLLYVEAVRSARSFLSGLRIAARLKPVVVVRAGRRGADAGGSSRASDDAFDAALARAGAVRVSSVEQMFAAAQLLAQPRPTAGHRLAILTNGRGPSLLAADRAADLGVVLPPLAPETRQKLDAVIPSAGPRENPVDLLGDGDAARYAAAVGACLADPGVDAVLAMLAPLALASPADTAASVIAASKGAAKPHIACWMGEDLVRAGRALFVEAGIPVFATPDGAVEAVSVLASYRRNQQLLRQVPGPVAPEAMPQLDLARDVVESALSRGRDTLTSLELRKLLATIGVRDRSAAGERVTGTELFATVSRDGVFGPVIRFGRGTRRSGGGAPVAALPPLNTAIIETLLQTSRLAPVLGPEGGMTDADVAAAQRMLWALSEIVSELPQLIELEIHGLVAVRGEMYASGARATVALPATDAGRYGHMAIHPYPSALARRVELPGGLAVLVRPIRPEDAGMEASFVRNLSDAARYFRFMVALKELPREMLIRFTQIDYDRELALVALVPQGDREVEIGVARYVMVPDASCAQVAIVIADEWQHRGIGSRLFGMIIDAARERGIRRLEGEVLFDNAAARALVTRFGFSLRPDPESAEICLIEKILA